MLLVYSSVKIVVRRGLQKAYPTSPDIVGFVMGPGPQVATRASAPLLWPVIRQLNGQTDVCPTR